jgi:hypothetical protein
MRYDFALGPAYPVAIEFDRFRSIACRKSDVMPPATFKGVSGSGLWRVPIVRREGAWENDVDFGKFRLAGVVFHESDPNDYQTIRAHGPVCLYKVFFPALQEQFG